MKLFEPHTHHFVQLTGDQKVEDGEQNPVLFLNVIPHSFRKPVRKTHKLSGLGFAKRVFQFFHERPLLRMFQQQVAYGACLRPADPHQFGK